MYITDALKVITENTARNVGGSVITARFADITSNEPKEERTEEQIVNELKNKLRNGV